MHADIHVVNVINWNHTEYWSIIILRNKWLKINKVFVNNNIRSSTEYPKSNEKSPWSNDEIAGSEGTARSNDKIVKKYNDEMAEKKGWNGEK